MVLDDGAGRRLVLDAGSGDVLAEHAPELERSLRDLAIVPSNQPLLVALHPDNLLTVRSALEPGPGREITIPEGDWHAFEIEPNASHTLILRESNGALVREQAPQTDFRRVALGRVENFDAVVQFDKRAIPRRTWWSIWCDLGSVNPLRQEPVTVDPEGSVHRHLGALESSVVGFRWEW